jgi:hypothetical protein
MSWWVISLLGATGLGQGFLIHAVTFGYPAAELFNDVPDSLVAFQYPGHFHPLQSFGPADFEPRFDR